MKKIIYTPESPLRHPLRMAVEMGQDAWNSRALAKRLVVRDISAQYRQTLRGYLWAVLLPLMSSCLDFPKQLSGCDS